MPRLIHSLTPILTGAALVVALLVAVPQPAAAQQSRPASSPILTLDSERLIAQSAAGQAVEADLSQQSSALASENRRIETELADEEKDLTERRAAMTPEDFRAAALAFDEKVQRIREEQEAKLRGLQEQYAAARQEILQAADPVLVSIMQEAGAVIIMEKASVLASVQAIEVTDLAILRLDRAMAGEPGVIGGFDTGTAEQDARNAPNGGEGTPPTVEAPQLPPTGDPGNPAPAPQD